MWPQSLSLSRKRFFPPPSWVRGTQNGLRSKCKPFLCFSSSACAILQLLFQNSEGKDFSEENPVLQEHQLHLLLQRPSDVRNVSSSVPNLLLQRTETGPPGIRVADARWRCSTRLRCFFFFNHAMELAITLSAEPRVNSRGSTCAPAVTWVS